MTPFLLDTNIIVNVLRQRIDADLLVGKLLDQGHPLASCPITVTEIYAGMRSNEEKATTRAFMKSLCSPPAIPIGVPSELLERRPILPPTLPTACRKAQTYEA